MDQSCQSSGDSTITCSSSSNNHNANSNNNNTNRDHYLKHLNKLSHKISKPILTTGNTNANAAKRPPFDHNSNQPFNHSTTDPHQQQHQQPPVYNINKNDFRDVVQKLTGSPAHDRLSTPPPIHPPKPPSSRLQRIRPPPLAPVTNPSSSLLNSAAPLPPPQQPPANTAINPLFPSGGPTSAFVPPSSAPLSPLPPFPTAHAGAAESPVSAYMRHLQNSVSTVDSKNSQFSGFSPMAPRWNNPTPPPPQFTPAQLGIIPSPITAGTAMASQQFQLPTSQSPFGSFNWPHSPYGLLSPSAPQTQYPLPTSPSPFGCLNSPRSPYGFLSPSLLLSPSAFPLSPTLPVPSPRWRGV